MQKTWAGSLDQKDPLEKEMAVLSSILAWEILRTMGPSGLLTMGLQRVKCELEAKQQQNPTVLQGPPQPLRGHFPDDILYGQARPARGHRHHGKGGDRQVDGQLQFLLPGAFRKRKVVPHEQRGSSAVGTGH